MQDLTNEILLSVGGLLAKWMHFTIFTTALHDYNQGHIFPHSDRRSDRQICVAGQPCGLLFSDFFERKKVFRHAFVLLKKDTGLVLCE